MKFTPTSFVTGSFTAATILASILACGGAEQNNEDPNGAANNGAALPARSNGNICGDGPGLSGCPSSMMCEEHTDGNSYCFCPEGTIPGSGNRCVPEGGEPMASPQCSQLPDDHCEGQGVCIDVDEADCGYHTERGLTEPTVCATVSETQRPVGTCISSVADVANADPDAELCTFTQHWSNQTNLPIDCRCPQELAVSECKRPSTLNTSFKFGEGPRFSDLDQVDQLGGFQDGREMIIATSWSSSRYPKQGLLFAVNIDTGDRRIISGAFSDPVNGYTTEGEGPAFGLVTHTIKGSDGSYYVASVEENGTDGSPPVIFKVNPSDGAREIVYNANDAENYSVCPNGAPEENVGTKTVQLRGGNHWTMDPEGNHYFSAIGAAPGPSIVRVGQDGQSCEYVTRLADGPVTFEPANLGEGFDNIQFDFESLQYHDGKLWARSDKLFVEIDAATGQRKLLSDAKNGAVGAGCTGDIKCMGRTWTMWDPHHEVIWTWGSPSGDNLMVAIDPETGDRISAPCWHPELGIRASCDGNGAPLGGPMGKGAMIIDEMPPHDIFLAHDNEAVIRIDQATWNHNIISR